MNPYRNTIEAYTENCGVYDLQNSCTVVAKGKTKEKEIKISPWEVIIDPYVEVDYPLAFPNKDL